jgi:hypothetical protein
MKIAIFSLSEITSVAFSEKVRPLNEEAGGRIEFLNLSIMGMMSRFDGDANVVILNLPDYSTEHVSSIRFIRSRGFAGPILLLVSELKPWVEFFKNSVQFNNVKLLERPFEDGQLHGYLRRLLAVDTTPFRSYRRYEANKPAIVTLAPNDIRACVVRNISHGGACIQLDSDFGIDRNHEITLSINSDDSTEKYQIRARVAWIQKDSALAGVEFLAAIAEPVPGAA